MLKRGSLAIAAAGFVLMCAGAARAADATPPTETKGFSQDRVEVVDISKDFSGMEGRQLRLRRLTVVPGGVAATHSHKDRPSITYVVSGEIIDHREGDAPKKVVAGQSFLEPSSLTHWIENRGTEPAMLVAIDIFQTK
jgi:quercetin dioxygenase-like cupin family protein